MRKNELFVAGLSIALGCGPTIVPDPEAGGGDDSGGGDASGEESNEADGMSASGSTGGRADTGDVEPVPPDAPPNDVPAEPDSDSAGPTEVDCFEPTNLLSEGEYLGVAYGPDSETVAVGRSGNAPIIDRYHGGGYELWEQPLEESAREVGVDRSGEIVTVEGGMLRKWSPDGDPLWAVQVPVVSELSADPGGSVTVSSAGDLMGSPGSTITRYNKHGDEVWSAEFASRMLVRSPLPNGGFVAASGDGMTWSIVALTASGAELWSTPVDGPTNAPEVDADPDGNVYVAGDDAETLWLRKLGPDGSTQWTVQDVVGDSHDTYTGVAAIAGEVAVVGYTQVGDPLTAFVRRFLADGTESSTIVCANEPDSRAYGVALGEYGELTVVGAVAEPSEPYRRWRMRL